MARRREDRCELNIPTPQGELTIELGVPRTPMRLADIVPIVQHVTDLTAKVALEAEAKAGRPMSCKDGCAACCRQLVMMSPPEAFVLADWIVQQPAPARDAALVRFEAAEKVLEEAGVLASLRELLDDPRGRDVQAIAARYFDLYLDCPMLAEAERCAFYPARPLVCRDLYVTSPAEWCRENTLRVVQKVPTPPTAVYPLARLTARLTGEPLRLVPLPLALHYAEAHVELATRRWPGRELFEALLAELSG
jgi:Fe-S-cluster containining protein